MWIAVVVKSGEEPEAFQRTAVTGEDKRVVLEKALLIRNDWQTKSGTRKYRILLGTLTSEIITPVSWEEVPLSSTTSR